MDIRIGNYRLTSGPKDFTITEVKVNADKESKNIGKEYDTDASYHPTLESALNNVLKRGLLKSDATTLWELLKELQSSRTELKELFNQLV
jgi:hypothetical protein